MRSILLALASVASSLVYCAPTTAQKADKTSFIEKAGTKFTVFEHAATGVKLEYVTNSGICETTPGVNQYSGYLSVGTNMNMWFWFFEARHNASTAPLATWFNGGPGCSSMIGLFQENGPCRFVNGASTPSLNPYSWNEYANMLYIDQPIGTGFSYGTDPVTSTATAAPYVWAFLQAFYTQFPVYKSRDFGLFTESYGGHYGPQFSSYLQSQNAAISAGTVTGQKINLVALGINNGWLDGPSNYKSFIDYGYNNSYRQILSASKRTSLLNAYNNDCAPALAKCPSPTGGDSACVSATNICNSEIENPVFNAADYDVYDVRAASNDPNPPETYATYLASSSVKTKIGAQSTYQECNNAVYNQMVRTGDFVRSFLPALSTVVQSGIRVLLWAGDADMICNYIGNFNYANLVSWSNTATFASKPLTSYTVSGKAGGLFKTVSNLSWLQVYEAGHEVPFYQPALSLQVFKQLMSGEGLKST